MGIIRIFHKGDGKTVEPATTSTRPDQFPVVKHSRRWYGVWDGKIPPLLRPGEAEAHYQHREAERQAERAKLEADLAAARARLRGRDLADGAHGPRVRRPRTFPSTTRAPEFSSFRECLQSAGPASRTLFA